MTYSIGDIHGDLEILQDLLKREKLVDEQYNWLGEDNTIVFIGDYVDRGPESYGVVKFLMDFEQNVKERGGEFVALCGNHDLMLIAALNEFQDVADVFTYNGGRFSDLESFREDLAAIAWMKKRPFLFLKDDVLYQHSDTCKFYTMYGKTVEEINDNALDLMHQANEPYDLFCGMTDARYFERSWFKSEEEFLQNIDSYMKQLGADKIVHGHTKFFGNEPRIYYENKIINIDGSMSSGYRTDPDRGFIFKIKKIQDTTFEMYI